jgi:hypothetical protein
MGEGELQDYLALIVTTSDAAIVLVNEPRNIVAGSALDDALLECWTQKPVSERTRARDNSHCSQKAFRTLAGEIAVIEDELGRSDVAQLAACFDFIIASPTPPDTVESTLFGPAAALGDESYSSLLPSLAVLACFAEMWHGADTPIRVYGKVAGGRPSTIRDALQEFASHKDVCNAVSELPEWARTTQLDKVVSLNDFNV